jgi:hypothetical protein
MLFRFSQESLLWEICCAGSDGFESIPIASIGLKTRTPVRRIETPGAAMTAEFNMDFPVFCRTIAGCVGSSG